MYPPHILFLLWLHGKKPKKTDIRQYVQHVYRTTCSGCRVSWCPGSRPTRSTTASRMSRWHSPHCYILISKDLDSTLEKRVRSGTESDRNELTFSIHHRSWFNWNISTLLCITLVNKYEKKSLSLKDFESGCWDRIRFRPNTWIRNHVFKEKEESNQELEDSTVDMELSLGNKVINAHNIDSSNA